MSNIITIYCGTAPSSEPKEVAKKATSTKTRRRSTKTTK